MSEPTQVTRRYHAEQAWLGEERAAHDVLIHHDGIKRLHHPEVGDLELTFQSLDLPLPARAMHDLIIYTAEPGTPSEDGLRLLASLAATRTAQAG